MRNILVTTKLHVLIRKALLLASAKAVGQAMGQFVQILTNVCLQTVLEMLHVITNLADTDAFVTEDLKEMDSSTAKLLVVHLQYTALESIKLHGGQEAPILQIHQIRSQLDCSKTCLLK